jgi:hypothetical protein
MNIPTVSDIPQKMRTDTPSRPPTFADVAMKLVQDGPMYGLIGLVGVLAIKGQATATELVITGLASLLSKSWPRAVQLTGAGCVGLFYAARWLEPAALAALNGGF